MAMLDWFRVILWGDIARKLARALGLVLLFLVVALIAILALPQKPPRLSVSHDFGIGIDLNPAYGTVAVSFPNGSVRSIARVEGDATYREMMLRLSLRSSEHIHEPYENVGEALQDFPRHTRRQVLKKIGLPASTDVWILSKMVRALRKEATVFVGEPISGATVTIPHLAALYAEDLVDAFHYISLVYVESQPYTLGRLLPSTLAVYNGNGFGLCADYTNPTSCKDEESHKPLLFALAISYTHTSLIVSLASPGYYIEETAPIEDLRLGYDARNDNPNETFYWESVRDVLLFPIVDSARWRRFNITMVLVSGDAADILEFRDLLSEVVREAIEGTPVIADLDPTFVAARGVAELGKRAIFAQKAGEIDLDSALDL